MRRYRETLCDTFFSLSFLFAVVEVYFQLYQLVSCCTFSKHEYLWLLIFTGVTSADDRWRFRLIRLFTYKLRLTFFFHGTSSREEYRIHNSSVFEKWMKVFITVNSWRWYYLPLFMIIRTTNDVMCITFKLFSWSTVKYFPMRIWCHVNPKPFKTYEKINCISFKTFNFNYFNSIIAFKIFVTLPLILN